MTGLTGTRSLIAGGAGSVGEWIVRGFLRAGATVVVPSRSAQRLAALRAFVSADAPAGDLAWADRLHLIEGDIGAPEGAAKIRDEALRRCGRLDAVVAALGGTYEGRQSLMDLPLLTWQDFQQNNLNAHFIAARTLLPVLAQTPGASYTLLGGISAVVPVPRYGPVCVNSAAQLMMVRVLIEEMKLSGVRINQVMTGFVHTRARTQAAKPEWITAAELADFVGYLASPAGRMVSGAVLQLGDRPPLPPGEGGSAAGTPA
jgi:3-oxoacyl-[acyl-carrier protein] reductase